MSKRVAFLDYSPVFAGAERVLHNVISHIDRNKYEPLIIFPYPMEHQGRYDDLDCEKIYLASGLKWWMGSDRWKHPLRGTDMIKRLTFGNRIAKLIKEKNIDILDVNLMRVDVGQWVKATRKKTSAKIVGHYRSQEQDWVAQGDAQKLFDLIACVSKFSKMRFQLKGKFVRAEVLYDAIDIDRMTSSLTKHEAKVALGYSPDTLLLVSVGQLSVHKGHDTAIRAFARIADKYPQAKLLIAGGGREELQNYYRQIIIDCGVKDKVYMPGKQLGNIQDIYRAADLTLSLTKVGEGFGLVPYESALIGTPFIAPCFGAVTEFVENGKNGLLVDTNNLDAVVDKICYALDNLEECQKQIDYLIPRIKSELSPKALLSNLDLIYQSLYS